MTTRGMHRSFRLLAILILLAGVSWQTTARVASQTAARPRLAVLIVIDQMRADYFEQYADRFVDGFKRLAATGAVFANARYPYASTKTAEAHALMLSGWSPSGSGIIGDAWYDRATRTTVTAGASKNHRLLESTGEGGSPEQLLVHTLGDQLKFEDPVSIVLTASWKRYSAVLNGGQHANGAFWFDTATGHMVTSDYYMPSYPTWVRQFNASDLTAPFFGAPWLGHVLSTKSAPDEGYRTAFRATPYASDVLLAFATSLIKNSGVGRDEHPDLVSISFSSLDYVGHLYGPETPEFDATIAALDRQVGDLLRVLDATVGSDNYTVALTADHGAARLPEKERARGLDAGRLNSATFRSAIEKQVGATLGIAGPVVLSFDSPELYLDYATAAAQGVTRSALNRAVAAAVEAQPGIARAYTVEQIVAASASTDPLLKAVAAGYYASRSGDIYVLVKPRYIFQSTTGTTHGTPYDYDTHVPMILMGHGIRPGWYDEPVRINDMAPTLARILGVTFAGDREAKVWQRALAGSGTPR